MLIREHYLHQIRPFIVVATIMTTVSTRGDVVYENDFTTRTTSDLPPDGEWSEYRYGKGVALAYNFDCAGGTEKYYDRPKDQATLWREFCG